MFTLEFYTRRWGHGETTRFKRTATGWEIETWGMPGFNKAGKDGEPVITGVLDHEGANYPAAMGDYLEWLWEQMDVQNLDDAQVQEAFEELGQWVVMVEKESPSGLFQQYK